MFCMEKNHQLKGGSHKTISLICVLFAVFYIGFLSFFRLYLVSRNNILSKGNTRKDTFPFPKQVI